MKLKLEIKFEEVADYDSVGSVLRIRGKNVLENEHVKVQEVKRFSTQFHLAEPIKARFLSKNRQQDNGNFEEASPCFWPRGIT
nr:protein PELOTA 2-like [Quercus suber]